MGGGETDNCVIEVNNVKKYYIRKTRKTTKRWSLINKEKVKSVDGVSFTMNEGEILGVVGESGCGKSTLGKVLVNLESLSEGSVNIRGLNSNLSLKNNQLAFRKKVQIIFQNPFDTFDPRYTIEKILLNVMKLHDVGSNTDERRMKCIEILENAGLTPAKDILKRYPYELSGGQLQRISIVRSMLLKPDFLVADEPVSMLDVSVRADIMNMLKQVCKIQKTAMVFISHDLAATRYIADRIAVMYLGRIIEIGSTEEIIQNPQHPYTKALISNSMDLDEDIQNKSIIYLKGEPPTPVNAGPGCFFEPRCPISRASCSMQYPDVRAVSNHHEVYCPYGTDELDN
ncbi:ABC transporter ATP-binding protein [Oceanobacillus neutriphilus]|uniref:Oligopeptide ABC transporter ATP-binding protein n=1 Tax=Oceanobacillus neutriphilus TaxID=531815 RepID=A0ABQ2NPX3_9BACI|nr:ABC transporter ATP-binding protein [Oceanobacillus neutriphilus]GGP06838.1 oligopeptide ABC transporter ATP-binding protein [Oceanobacillus neutriphilus]